MKTLLPRLLVYAALFGIVFSLFGVPIDTDGPLPGSTMSGQIGYYAAFYGVTVGFWLVLFETTYRIARWLRRKSIDNAPTKELDVPETRRLDSKP